MRAAHFILFILLLTSQTAFADFQLNLTPGVTTTSHDIYQLHMTVLWICVAIGVIVFGVMLYSILFHRKSRGSKAAHFHEHAGIEILWSIIPFLILIVMAIPATRVLIHMNDFEKPDLTIKITGYQWKWKYEYFDKNLQFFSNLSTPFAQLQNKAPKTRDYLQQVDHPLVVPIHKKIRFLVTSNDVIHSWWVPDLAVKRDAVPGFINEAWTRINRPGTYHGQCAELCGMNHGFMPIVVVAMAEKDFDRWLAQQKGEALPSSSEPAVKTETPIPDKKIIPLAPAAALIGKKSLAEQMQRGEKVYMSFCVVCHQPTGEGMPPTFPALKGGLITTGPLPKHIDRVINGKLGTAMQAFREQLNDEDIAAVITYERHSWGNNKEEVVQSEEIDAAKKLKPMD